jgi:hypothetical protein
MPEGYGQAIRLSPKSAGDSTSDALPPGFMASLSNLVPNPLAPDQWVPRPAAQLLPSTQSPLPGSSGTPGFVSCAIVIGTRVYGMVATARNAGKDEPFSYNLVGNSYDTVSGITSGNVPTSPPTSGAWTPPTMDIVGTKIVVTHPGFNGAGNGFFGTIDISTVSAPVWSSGNTSTNALPAVPTYVKQFFNRAYFVVSPAGLPPATYATDALNPNSASQPFILTFGGASPITALGVLGLQNMFGGIIHALMVFKSIENNVYQVTGDFAPDGSPGSLVLNSLEIATTTVAPLGVAPTPRGLAFLSPDGLRIIDWTSKVSDPIGISGTGITQAFTQSLVPSRMVMACNGQSIRITTQNNAVPNQPVQEWVYDLELKKWHGPHTFPWSLIVRNGLSYVGAGPFSAPIGGTILNGLWASDIIPNTQSQYTENGAQLSWTYTTSLLNTEGDIYEKAIVFSTIGVSGDAISQGLTCTALDANNSALNTTTVTPASLSGSRWGSMIWGSSSWGAVSTGLFQLQIPWTVPIVADRVSFQIQGMSASGIALGELRAEVETLSYIA